MMGRTFQGSVLVLAILGSTLGWAADPPAQSPPAPESKEKPVTQADREHWSFRPPVRPVVPQVRKPRWVRNPIDAFILANLEDSELAPAPEADRSTLLRRLSFDLTGLPPTPEELEFFLNDR